MMISHTLLIGVDFHVHTYIICHLEENVILTLKVKGQGCSEKYFKHDILTTISCVQVKYSRGT